MRNHVHQVVREERDEPAHEKRHGDRGRGWKRDRVESSPYPCRSAQNDVLMIEIGITPSIIRFREREEQVGRPAILRAIELGWRGTIHSTAARTISSPKNNPTLQRVAIRKEPLLKRHDRLLS